MVYLVDWENLTKADTISFQDPIVVTNDYLSILVVLGLNMLCEGDLGDFRETFDAHVLEQRPLELFKKSNVLLRLLIIKSSNSDSDYLLLCVFIRVHDSDHVTKGIVQFLVDLSNTQVLLNHSFRVKLESHDPGRDFLILLGLVVENGNLVVQSHEGLISLNDGLLGIRIVEDLRTGYHIL